MYTPEGGRAHQQGKIRLSNRMIAFRFRGGESQRMGIRDFEVRDIMDTGTRRERAEFFVRPLLGMNGSSRLAVGVGNEDFEVERGRNGLVADHAGLEAILAYGSEDACVHVRTSGLHDLKIRGLAGLINDHADNDFAVVIEHAGGARRICYDIYFVDQLGSDDSG
jgi:hypothetical protein